MTFPRSVALVVVLAALSACSSDDDDGEEGVSTGGTGAPGNSDATFEDFRDQVRDAAGPDAEACGELETDASEIDANSCLARAFTNGTGAWSTVRRQGTDSTVVSGTAVRDGSVTFYGFDSDPGGSAAEDNGRISTTECVGPSLSGVIGDSQTTPTFECEEFASNESVIMNTSAGGCDEPVELLGANQREFADGYIVAFDDSVDVSARSAELAEQYPDLVVLSVFQASGSFLGDSSEETLESIRCESGVTAIEFNTPSGLPIE